MTGYIIICAWFIEVRHFACWRLAVYESDVCFPSTHRDIFTAVNGHSREKSSSVILSAVNIIVFKQNTYGSLYIAHGASLSYVVSVCVRACACVCVCARYYIVGGCNV